jgi:hypothetical protein
MEFKSYGKRVDVLKKLGKHTDHHGPEQFSYADSGS